MAKPGRNDLCSCGSRKKYKKCHGVGSTADRSSRVLMVVVGAAVLAALAAGVSSFTTSRSSSSVRVWDSAHGHYHNASGVQVP
jgi:uncharacterized protein YecA (UPF0149 family)